MQTFKSQYGRKGIRVSDLCPTRSITRMLGKTHVGTLPETVAATVRLSATAKDDERWTPALVTEAVRFALWRHAENLAEYQFVMGGH
jgi:hypothetical protein